jgi:CheY-like chemotaxis protein
LGKLKAYRTPGGQYRIEPHVLAEFMHRHGMPVPEELSPAKSLRIVVVDDQVEIGQGVMRVLGKESGGSGYEVETALDGYTAGRLVQSQRPDLVILDIRMPGIDGFAVCENIKSDPATRGAKILIMSAFITKENVARLKALGADAFLEKPFDIAILKEKVQKLIGLPTRRDVARLSPPPSSFSPAGCTP